MAGRTAPRTGYQTTTAPRDRGRAADAFYQVAISRPPVDQNSSCSSAEQLKDHS
jgi:hypothetical protein